jgi:D-alanyl-D-alanine carboxypeptidase
MKKPRNTRVLLKMIAFVTIVITVITIIVTITFAIGLILQPNFPKDFKHFSGARLSDTVQASPPTLPAVSPSSAPALASVQQPTNLTRSLMGHLYYQEAPQNHLIVIASYAQQQYQRFEYLDQEAAKALMKLIYVARDEGVWIIPVSGFRTVERQKLLFNEQMARLGSDEAAAKVSAPAGYSEHHTGYAVDLSDGRFPKQDITNAFVDSDAYRWLNQHAKEYGFEMSFPLNNSQGVMFEPWHWRFIGSPDASTIFPMIRDSP